MPFKIAIASGKGGTGKTSVSVQLFLELSKKQSCTLVDCDVEEPNDRLFFPKAELQTEETINQLVANIDTEKCTFCRKCVEYCEFNSISVIPPLQYAKVDASLCHSCGACLYACEDGAVFETAFEIGKMRSYKINNNLMLEGLLKIGSPMQTSLIRSLKKKTPQDASIIIYDAPPGTSCPVVETIADSDYIILVTEPTPFGLHDLKLTVDLVQDMNMPFGIIINKSGLGYEKLHEFINDKHLELLAEIPFSKSFAKHYSKGDIVNMNDQSYTEIFEKLSSKLMKKKRLHD